LHYVLLSCNIAIPQFVYGYLQGLPQLTDCYIGQFYNSGSVLLYKNEEELENDTAPSLSNFLKQANSGWYSADEIPFATVSKDTTANHNLLEAELHRTYFLLKLGNFQNADVIILCKAQPLGMKKDKYLLANEKLLLSSTIKHLLSNALKTYTADRQTLHEIGKLNTYLKDEIEELQTQVKQQAGNHEIALSKFVQALLKELSKDLGVQIIQSPAFIQTLKNYTYPIDELDKVLKHNLLGEVNLALAMQENEIVLQPRHLNQAKVSANKQSKTSNLELGRYSSTFNLLTRYETAAEKAAGLGLNIIGKNIGKMCSPPISNAAITDALNKHARKIYELFDRFPNKWPIIRSEFKSVSNVMDKEIARRQAIA
jgi:hypothetical protein